MSDTPVRVAVCIPSHGDPKMRFAKSLADMMGFTQSVAAKHFGDGEFDMATIVVGGAILPEVRTRLVAQANKWNATHILWCDSDMVFPPDAFVRLYNHGKHIVGINYPTRDLEARPVAYVEDDDDIGPLYTEQGDTGLRAVKHTGFGFMLTTMHLYNAMTLPYFHFELVEPQNVIHKGEDVYFCKKVKRETGEDIWVDQDLSREVVHIGNWSYTHAQSIEARNTREGRYEDRWQEGGVGASMQAWLEKHGLKQEAAE